jgi:phosphatidate cytidylyltransferase
MFFIPAIILIFFTGGIVLSSFLALVVLGLLFELREILFRQNIILPRIVLVQGVLVFMMSAYYGFFPIFASLLLVFITVAGTDIFLGRISGSFHRISAGIFACIYTAVFMSSLYKIRMLPNGGFLLFSLIGLIWLTDSAAYFAGRYWGKHRNVFSVSPNKSAEGFIAGILMSFIAALIFGYLGKFTLSQSLALAISVGIFGQFGDLFESMLKRDVGIKDSSHFLPGHGGILDRFDSLLLASPVFYVLLNLI